MPRERVSMRWLHISDLHLGHTDTYTQDIVLGSLLRSFERGEPLADFPPDLIFCTGDVAYSGKPEEYREAVRFFDALSRATGVTNDRIIVVPGNHDVDRTKIGRRFRLEITTRDEADEFFGDDDAAIADRIQAWPRFAAFADFQSDHLRSPLHPAEPYSIWHIVERGLSVGVVGLNTAWLALDGTRSGDIVVGERLVRKALDVVSGADRPGLVVALLHHPLEWLAEFERARIEELLVESCDLILYGHLHEERPWGVQTPQGAVAMLGAGAASQGRGAGRPNTAFIGEIHGDRARVQGVRFQDRGHGIWTFDPSLAPREDGVIEIRLAGYGSGGSSSETGTAERVHTVEVAADPLSACDVSRYRRHIDLVCGHVVLTGLLTERASSSIPIESVYVPLRANWPGMLASASGSDGRPTGEAGADDPRFFLTRFGETGADLPESPSDEHRRLLHAELERFGLGSAVASAERVQDAVWTRLRERTAGGPRGVEHDVGIVDILRTAEIDLVLGFAQHVLIEGDPGSGKTTQLKHVAMALHAAWAGSPDRALAMGFADPFPLPVFVELRKFAAWLAERNDGDGAPGHARLLVEYLGEIIGPVSGGEGWLEPALESGRLLVLLDGVDEVADERLRRLVGEVVHDFLGADAYGACRFVITSRPAGLTPEVRVALGDLAHCEVQPLETPQIELFVRAWYDALIQDPAEAGDKAGDLIRRIADNEDVAALAVSPIMLTIISIVHQTRGSLPERRADLYEQCTAALADRWDQSRGVPDHPECPKLSLKEKLRLFQELAWETHVRGQNAPPLERDEAVRILRNAIPALASLEEESCRHLLQHLGDRSGIVIPEDHRTYRFRHLSFQEFLTARRICDYWRDPWRPLVDDDRLSDPWWREVVLLTPAIKAIGSSADAKACIRALCAHAAALTDDEARVAALALISRAFRDLQEYDITDLPAALSEALDPMLALIDGSPVLAEETERIAMAEAIGIAGDPRLTDAAANRVPVPGGTFLMGAQDNAPDRPGYDPHAFTDEGPPRQVTVEPFELGRYPVTVQEFRRFMETDQSGVAGYFDPRFWDPEGWAWREREAIKGPDAWSAQLKHPNRPVVGVSWYEADAFAHWVDGRLPSEEEREWAARGATGRRYPWGEEEPTSDHAAFAWRIKEPAPVGVYSLGATPETVQDLAGNVWEWCGDLADDRLRGTDSYRVLRGGSFISLPHLLRGAVRDAVHPVRQSRYFGFRVSWSASGGQ